MRKSLKHDNGKCLEDMQTPMDALTKLVNNSHKVAAGTAPVVVSSGLQVKLVPLTAHMTLSPTSSLLGK